MSRLRAKTSGLGEFFRGTGRPDENMGTSAPPSNGLDVPAESPTRKRASKIPFLGRARKKSLLADTVQSDLEEDKVKERDEHASFGAKLASHFTPTRSRRPSERRSSRSLAAGSLVPPMSMTRSSSVDTTDTRATTPRPTITVSGDLSEYEDLFTRPNRKSTASVLTTDSQPPSPKIAFPSVNPDDPVKSPPPLPPPQAEDADRTLTNPTFSEKRRSFPAIPFKSRVSPPQHKSLPSLLPHPTKPPSEPLPPPPPLPSPPLPSVPQNLSRKSSEKLPRQRAQTLTSLSPAPPPPSSSLPSLPVENTTTAPPIPTSHDDLDIDTASIEQLRLALKAKIHAFDQLTAYLTKITEAHTAEKALLDQRVVQLEKDARRKDKEIKGLTWLVSNNRPGSSGNGTGNIAGSLSDSASKSMSSLLDSMDGQRSSAPTPTAIRVPQYRRLVAAEDSGAESSHFSGAESPHSGNESSSSLGTRVRRHKLLDPKGFPNRSSSMKHQFVTSGYRSDLTVPDIPKTTNINIKRASISSVASTTSTSSSLLTPSPTPTVLSHLTAIPESPPPPQLTHRSTTRSTPTAPPSLLPSLKATRDPAIIAAIQAAEQLREKEEQQRRTRSNSAKQQRITPSQTPAAAYAANLKRGLSPSIAQVLDQVDDEQESHSAT